VLLRKIPFTNVNSDLVERVRRVVVHNVKVVLSLLVGKRLLAKLIENLDSLETDISRLTDRSKCARVVRDFYNFGVNLVKTLHGGYPSKMENGGSALVISVWHTFQVNASAGREFLGRIFSGFMPKIPDKRSRCKSHGITVSRTLPVASVRPSGGFTGLGRVSGWVTPSGRSTAVLAPHLHPITQLTPSLAI
jgi:hypothetical protein